MKTKEKWVKNIKVLLMESIPGLPDKVHVHVHVTTYMYIVFIGNGWV